MFHAGKIFWSCMALGVGSAWTLRCYESPAPTDDAAVRTEEQLTLSERGDYAYCAYTQPLHVHPVRRTHRSQAHVEHRPPSLFGVNQDSMDLTQPDAVIGRAQATTAPLYQVLAYCLIEVDCTKYGDAKSELAPEYMFICLCNADGCNKATSFKQYEHSVLHAHRSSS